MDIQQAVQIIRQQAEQFADSVIAFHAKDTINESTFELIQKLGLQYEGVSLTKEEIVKTYIIGASQMYKLLKDNSNETHNS